jgi:hypothetical protein
VVTKSSIIWDPCNPFKVNWRFRETYRLHSQNPRISQEQNQSEASSKQRATCFMLVLAWFHPSALKTKVIYFFKTSVDFQRIEVLCVCEARVKICGWSFWNKYERICIVNTSGRTQEAISTRQDRYDPQLSKQLCKRKEKMLKLGL